MQPSHISGSISLGIRTFVVWVFIVISQHFCFPPTRNPSFKTCQCTVSLLSLIVLSCMKNQGVLPHFSVNIPPSYFFYFSGILLSYFLVIRNTNSDNLSNGLASRAFELFSSNDIDFQSFKFFTGMVIN